MVQAKPDDVYITGMNADGVSQKLLDSRSPALYTGDFGDCMGGQSLINVTLFDAAYYADNMTVLFHVAGKTNLRDESVMSKQNVSNPRHQTNSLQCTYLSMLVSFQDLILLLRTNQADGEDRFNMIFNPCNANIARYAPCLLLSDRTLMCIVCVL